MNKRYVEYIYSGAEAPTSPDWRELSKQVLKLIRAYKVSGRVCELGCGNGSFVKILADYGYEVIGVDASKSGIDAAKSSNVRERIEFKCATIDDDLESVLGEGVFDVVVGIEVIEHLYQPRKFASLARKLLKPGGVFIISTPYHGYLKNLVISLLGFNDRHYDPLWDSGHIKFFSVGTIKKLLHNEGFKEMRFSFYGRAPFLWKSMIVVARVNDSIA